MKLIDCIKQMQKNGISVEIGNACSYVPGTTHFGGVPDVPPDFVWPTFEGEGYNNEIKVRPLSFLAQFQCAELQQYDTEHLLPDHGVLSFFYDMETQLWGFDPKDRGCARVFWFEDRSELSAAEFPNDLEEDYRFPACRITLKRTMSLPDYEDYYESCVIPGICDDVEYGIYTDVKEELLHAEEQTGSKLLGWADIIQNSMRTDCELVSMGYYLGHGWSKIPDLTVRHARKTACDRWVLLFQLDTIENDTVNIMFGDCGSIYFYIPKEDLKARRFDRVWLILQCG